MNLSLLAEWDGWKLSIFLVEKMGVVERTLGRICPHIDSLNAAIPVLIWGLTLIFGLYSAELHCLLVDWWELLFLLGVIRLDELIWDFFECRWFDSFLNYSLIIILLKPLVTILTLSLLFVNYLSCIRDGFLRPDALGWVLCQVVVKHLLVCVGILNIVLQIFILILMELIIFFSILEELLILVLIIGVDPLFRVVIVKDLEFYLFSPLFGLVLLRGPALSNRRACWFLRSHGLGRGLILLAFIYLVSILLKVVKSSWFSIKLDRWGIAIFCRGILLRCLIGWDLIMLF